MNKYHLSRFNWAYLNSNDYNIDQKVEYFNNVLNKLFISHIPNINNTIKQVLPKNKLKLKKQLKNYFENLKLICNINLIRKKQTKMYPKN